MVDHLTRMKVMMIGPDPDMPSGISALVKSMLPMLKTKVDLHYFTTVRDRPLAESGLISFRNLIGAIDQYIRFLRALQSFHPQIIHLHTSRGLAWLKDAFYILVGRARGARIVLHMHGGNFDLFHRNSPRFIQHFTQRMLLRADLIISVSAEWLDRVADILSLPKTLVLRNCINLAAFPAHKHQSNGAKTHGLLMGRVSKAKGAFDLIESVGRLKDHYPALRVAICGGEELPGERARALERIRELGIEEQCNLPGRVAGEQKERMLQNTDLFILPSYDEVLPMALLEGMASGAAVIATAVGGIPEIVENSINGFLINPGDVDDLTAKIALLLDHPHIREEMGKRSRELVKQHLDVIPYVTKLTAAYQQLIDKKI
ncbi:MAG: glycosyltransferase family 4 protein [Anaerolineaceae bacterium]|nr:glycosyltransferase family 4 protein [Anaerolineaceae bacterium]